MSGGRDRLRCVDEGGELDRVGLGGNIVGALVAPWLGIPRQHHPVFMRYHEYYRIEAGKVVEMQGLWDMLLGNF